MWPNLLFLMLVLAVMYRRPLWHKWLKPWLARNLSDATLHTTAHQRSAANAVAMSIAQAREILGVNAEANPDAIILAHKRLIQKLHPDRGGNEYLATQVNVAKQILLNEFKTR